MKTNQLVKFAAAVVALVGAVALMAQSGKIVATGTFHGAAHNTSGRATVYSGENEALTLRLTNFKTSNGPNLHVLRGLKARAILLTVRLAIGDSREHWIDFNHEKAGI